MATVVTSSLLLAGAAAPSVAGDQSPPARAAAAPVVGLWDSDFGAHMSDEECGRWRLDARGFCTANDSRNGVELGMKFLASRSVEVTGVRIYRTDLGTVTGSLWDSSGSRLATGRFADTSTTGWQDLVFARPVTISAGRTYVASFHSPATKYAFSYGYFEQQVVRGPITALRAVSGDPNGVHCYDNAPCPSFPVRPYRSTSYWITPLWQDRVDTAVPPPAVTSAPTDVEPPTVTASRPATGATRVRRGQSIRITFSEQVRENLLTASAVRLLQKGRRGKVPVRLRYSATRHRLVVRPVRRLRPHTAYRVVIMSRVTDVAGNRLDQDASRAGAQRATWKFRTR